MTLRMERRASFWHVFLFRILGSVQGAETSNSKCNIPFLVLLRNVILFIYLFIFLFQLTGHVEYFDYVNSWFLALPVELGCWVGIFKDSVFFVYFYV